MRTVLLRRHATRDGVSAPLDLTAADLPGKPALVAAGHRGQVP
ncbi:hypothetical protein [Streptomyces griseoluteus]